MPPLKDNPLMKVLIIEDEPLTVLGLKQTIKDINPKVMVQAVASLESAYEIASTTHFELVILDIDIRGKAGTGNVQKLKADLPDSAILVITDLDEATYGLPYMQAGADGFLWKLAPSSQFETAIRSMMVIGKYASSGLQQQSIDESQAQRPVQSANPLMNISGREREVMEYLISGKSPNEIAELLNINRTTVGTHKMRILKKMQVSSLIKLIEKVKMLS